MLAWSPPVRDSHELAGLPKMNLVQNARGAVWFANGWVVEDDPNRQRAHFVVEQIDDPVLRLQEVLREKLPPRGRYPAAVSWWMSAARRRQKDHGAEARAGGSAAPARHGYSKLVVGVAHSVGSTAE